MSNTLREGLIELADKHFPKGDKGRGQAMVLVAEALNLLEGEKQKRVVANASFCGCPMCEHHTSAYGVNNKEPNKGDDVDG